MKWTIYIRAFVLWAVCTTQINARNRHEIQLEFCLCTWNLTFLLHFNNNYVSLSFHLINLSFFLSFISETAWSDCFAISLAHTVHRFGVFYCACAKNAKPINLTINEMSIVNIEPLMVYRNYLTLCGLLLIHSRHRLQMIHNRFPCGILKCRSCLHEKSVNQK